MDTILLSYSFPAYVRMTLFWCWGRSQEVVIPSMLIEIYYKCTNLSYTIQLDHRLSQSDTRTFKNLELLPSWLLPMKSSLCRTLKRAHFDFVQYSRIVGRREMTANILPTFKRNWWRNSLASNISNFRNVIRTDVCLAPSNVMG